MPETILLVEDKDVLREMVRTALVKAGHRVEEAHDGKTALEKIRARRFPLIITDLKLPGPSGLDLLRAAKELDESAAVILMTAYGTVDDAVRALKEGALDFIQKPFEVPHLLMLVERALGEQELRRVHTLWRDEMESSYGLPAIVGEDASLKAVEQSIQRVAPTEATVLLEGESGTGKELFARAIHILSPRRDRPFVTVNCAALPETLIENELFGHEKGAFTGAGTRKAGKVEFANHGTLFLDEIGELPLPTQAKLLRLIEEKVFERLGGTQTISVDARIVAATNARLREAVEHGRFRSDLFFRLAAFPVSIPPLRERGEDILALADYFLRKHSREFRKANLQFSPEARTALFSYAWPGNVRELANAIERAVILADNSVIGPEDLALGFAGSSASLPAEKEFDLSGTLSEATERAVKAVERAKISSVLEEVGGNRALAAEKLGISARILSGKLRELGLET
ncbi:MAG: transcriptional regulator [Acidobacteria bacterium]|nr:MAG: transcriptional regulator [Acidobacteriota bacterium]